MTADEATAAVALATKTLQADIPEPQPDVEDPLLAGEAGQADEQGDGGSVSGPSSPVNEQETLDA